MPRLDHNYDRKVSFGEFVQALWPFHCSTQDEERDPAAAQISYISTQQDSKELQDSVLGGDPGIGPPKVSVYERRMKMAVEFGAMQPDRQVQAVPDPKVLKFLR